METNQSDRKKTTKRKSTSLWLHKPKKRCNDVKKGHTRTTPSYIERPKKSGLSNAPRKPVRTGRAKLKRKLFDSSTQEKIVDEMHDLLPTVLKILYKQNIMSDFCNLFRLNADNKFPIHNIAFLLLLEVVRWYSLDNTSKMFYSGQTMKFWKVMYRLFHGKVLRFMAGLKSEGQVVKIPSLKGEYDPQSTQINFAVPSISAVDKFDKLETNIPKEIPPGILNNKYIFIGLVLQ